VQQSATTASHPSARFILTINAGSSTIKFALYEAQRPPQRHLHGYLDRIGSTGSTLRFERTVPAVASATAADSGRITVPEGQPPVAFLLDWLERTVEMPSVLALGHRLVHGLQHAEPQRVSEELLRELRRFSRYDPEHLPRELELIEAFAERYPHVVQVACFDTAFHHDMPRVAQLLPIPRRYQSSQVRRYGFHGLSYAYLLEELRRLQEPAARAGRLILAHLGSGASMCAVRDGRSIDTTMGFTPTSGLPMSTRTGDLDPGLVSFLMRSAHLDVAQFDHLANHESGLLGISDLSADVRELLEREPSDARAAEALALFCYQACKWIGAFAAALGGLEALVFSGGIGENAPVIRARICANLAFLGIELDRERNVANAGLISTAGGAVRVRVIRTDEQWMIANSVQRLLM
jgi:acetate kinase